MDMHLEEIAERYQLLIVIPHIRSEYYITHDEYDVDTFIACELKDYIRQHFELDEDVAFSLGGVSMGGYGAVLIGAHHPDYFKQIISVSGSFIQKDIVIGNPEVWGSVNDPRNAEDFLRVMVPVWDCRLYREAIMKGLALQKA